MTLTLTRRNCIIDEVGEIITLTENIIKLEICLPINKWWKALKRQFTLPPLG